MAEVDEQMIFEMGYNAGFKNGIKGSIPREQIDKIVDEINECIKACNEIMSPNLPQIYTRGEMEARILTYEQVLEFIHKYTDN